MTKRRHVRSTQGRTKLAASSLPAAITACVTTLERAIYKNIPSFLPTKSYKPEYTLTVPTFDEGLEFFSRFENGNLKKSVRVSKTEYDLYLSEDYNTGGHFHWFFFKTRSTLPAGTVVQFRILNMVKPASLYSAGFRPFAYSIRDWRSKGTGWAPAGDSISYQANSGTCTVRPEDGEGLGNGRKFYTLQWKFVYDNANDEVYFAQFPPYTYSDLLGYLKDVKEQNGWKDIVRIDSLCKTLAGNCCPVLTITEKVSTYLEYRHEKALEARSKSSRQMLLARVEKLRSKLHLKQAAAKSRRANAKKRSPPQPFKDDPTEALVDQAPCEGPDVEYSRDRELEGMMKVQNNALCSRTAKTSGGPQGEARDRYHCAGPSWYRLRRQNIGEVPSSWVMKGVIDFLISDVPEARSLRSQYVFKLVPMLNPDGVVYGNYRCSLLGYDLNRRWKSPSRLLQPTIFHSKQMVHFMSEEREIALYYDLHGHSTQKNVFMYGCSFGPGETDHIQRNAAIRVVPLLMAQRNPGFSYKSSRFVLEKCKEATARIVLFKEFRIANSYTCESSFFGFARACKGTLIERAEQPGCCRQRSTNG